MTVQLDLDERPGAAGLAVPAAIPEAVTAGRREGPPQRVRRRAALAAVAVAICTLAVAALHLVPAGRVLDPVSAPISDYAQTRDGWLFALAVLVLAAGLAALRSALVTGGWATHSCAAVLGLCSLGMVLVAIFPDSAAAGGGLTTAGWIHWIAAMTAFGGIPLVPKLLGRRCGTGSGCARVPSAAHWLARFAALWFFVLLGGSVLRFTHTVRVWPIGGAVERCLAVADMLVAIVLAGWVQRAAHGTQRNCSTD
jgi:hypothetical protein